MVGPAGAMGPAGSSSPAGADGSKITGSIYCRGSLENTTLYFSYNAVQFGSGAVFASAAIKANDIQASGANFYAMAQNGWDAAPVSITFDATMNANAGWWDVRLNRTTLVVTIDYNDTDVMGGKRSWTMTPDKCVVNKY
jgi:hypothetical protein